MEIRALTGARGAAAMLVVLYHIHAHNSLLVPLGLAKDTMLNGFLMHGYLAVDFFFILSGFLLTKSFMDSGDAKWTRGSYGQFLWRRFSRLYPLYAMITLFGAAMIMFGFGSPNLANNLGSTLVSNLAVVQAWGVSPSINGPVWSVSVDFIAYLLFPAFIIIIQSFSRLRSTLIIMLLCVAVLIALQIITHDTPKRGPLDIVNFRSPLPILRGLAEFCLGISTYFLLNRSALLSKIASHKMTGFMLLISIIGLLLVPQSDFAIVALLPFFIAHLAVSANGVSTLLKSSFMIWLGEISYSVYLLHAQFFRVRTASEKVFVHYLEKNLASNLAVLVMLSLLVLCAWLSYRYFERPVHNRLKHYFKQKEDYVPVPAAL